MSWLVCQCTFVGHCVSSLANRDTYGKHPFPRKTPLACSANQNTLSLITQLDTLVSRKDEGLSDQVRTLVNATCTGLHHLSSPSPLISDLGSESTEQ